MKQHTLWQVSVATTAEAEDAVAEILQTQFGRAAAGHTDAKTGITCVKVFLESRPDWARGRVDLLSALERLSACGLNAGPGRVSIEKLRPQNWAESWKHHFKPLAIHARLLIKPSWSKRPGRKGQVVVVLDPGLSFGTGQHPTTRFCLRQLVERRTPTEPQSLWDLGTGSGILAIGGAHLGYGPIEAVDVDLEALRTARANARLNGVEGRIRFLRRDLANLPRHASRRFSIVCANLNSNLLLGHKEKIISRISRDGVLVLAGVLRAEFAAIQRVYEAAGLRLISSRAEGEWRSAEFQVVAPRKSGHYPTTRRGRFFE